MHDVCSDMCRVGQKRYRRPVAGELALCKYREQHGAGQGSRCNADAAHIPNNNNRAVLKHPRHWQSIGFILCITIVA